MSWKSSIINLLRLCPPHNHVKAEIVSIGPNELLAGKGALITGGAGGIGSAIAEAMVKAGAKVVLLGRNEDKLKEAVARLTLFNNGGGGNTANYIVADLGDISNYDNIIKNASAKLGDTPLSILVNNAGILGEYNYNCSESSFNKIMDTNVKSMYFLSHKVGKYMVERNIKGNILNISSISGHYPAICPYEVSKWSVNGITLGLAKLFIQKGIVVNAIAPGYVATAMLGKDKNSDIAHDANPIGRYIMPEEIANMAVFCTSGMGRSMVGTIIDLNGGSSIINDDSPVIDY